MWRINVSNDQNRNNLEPLFMERIIFIWSEMNLPLKL